MPNSAFVPTELRYEDEDLSAIVYLDDLSGRWRWEVLLKDENLDRDESVLDEGEEDTRELAEGRARAEVERFHLAAQRPGSA